jgi:hypothetical protein
MAPTSPTLRRWLEPSWQEAANLCLLLMEGVWLACACGYLTTFNNPVAQWKMLLSLTASLLAGYYLARISDFWHVRLSYRRGALAMLIIISLWFNLQITLYAPYWQGPFDSLRQIAASFAAPGLIPSEFYVLAFTALAWQRGVSLASQEVLEHLVLNSLLAGSLLSLIPGVISGWEIWPGWLWLLVVCFGLGLAAMAAARLAHLSELRGGHSPRFTRRWMLGVAAGAVSIAGLGAGLALILLGTPGQIIGQLVQIILGAITFLMLLALSPLINLLLGLVRWIQNHSINDQSVGNAFNRILEQLNNLTNLPDEMSAQTTSLFDVVKPYLLWGMLLVIFISAVFFLVHRWQVLRRAQEEALEPVGASAVLRDALKSLRKGLGQAVNTISGRLRANQAARMLQAIRIRWVYTQLMRLCDQKGHPRPQALTPLEFIPVLVGLYPGKEDAINTITQAYLRVRYGLLPETSIEVDQVMQAWESIQQSK